MEAQTLMRDFMNALRAVVNDGATLADIGYTPNGDVPEPQADMLRVLSLARESGMGWDDAFSAYLEDPESSPILAQISEPYPSMLPLPHYASLPPELAAQASPWLDRYVAFSRLWSPRAFEGFHEAAGLWLLSAIAARRVALNLGTTVFTNLYIAWVALTSIFAKSTTADVAMHVLREAGLDFLLAPDDSTPQAFVHSLTEMLPDDWDDWSSDRQERFRRKAAFSAQRGWYYEEFGMKVSAMMRDGGIMADFRGILRKFDDTPERYEYTTIGRGSDVVIKPYVALLANMTPADLRPYAKRGAALWNDGFWARFAFISPAEGERRGRGRFPDGERIVPDDVSGPLMRWHRRLGVPTVEVVNIAQKDEKSPRWILQADPLPVNYCRLGEGVRGMYDRYSDALLDMIEDEGVDDLSGNYARFPAKALRVSMLLASLENDGLIEARHWARGQAIAERWRRYLHNLYDRLNNPKTEEERAEEQVIAFIRDRKRVTIRQIHRGIRRLNPESARILVQGLEAAGVIKAERTDHTVYYSLKVQEMISATDERRRHVNASTMAAL